MKIAIISMQSVVNFGSVLQAYSLREMIREVTGEEAEFVEVENTPALPSRYSIPAALDYETKADLPGGIVQKGKRWAIARLSARNKDLIRQFMKDELKLDASNNDKHYDWAVIGSDEVFNHAKGVRLQLHGAVRQAENVISYAASCGSALAEDIDEADVPALRQAMGRFSALSLRDENTQRYAANFYDGEVHHHLDPVLAGDLHCRKPRAVPLKKYLLVYAYGQRIRTNEEIRAIQDFARKRGLKTVAMGGSQFWCDLYIPASPFRLLDYFYHADYVLTDTFHGAIFSVINKRPFAVMIRRTNRGKLTSLLRDLGLEARQVDQMTDLDEVLSAPIDYEQVETILERERKRSRSYLKEHLTKMELRDQADCSACGACITVCPKQAVSMAADETGCLYPRIDPALCIQCGACQRVCGYGKTELNPPMEAYAAVGREEVLVRSSASGGVFATLAKRCMADGGLTAGAVMDLDGTMTVRHIITDDPAQLPRLQGSKYVQSEAWQCYEDVRAALKQGRTVLFSGTPCQVAAVKRLTGDPGNLITMDLICHGVPPKQLLAEFLEILERRLGSKIRGFSFRDKSCGKAFCARIDMERGSRYLQSRFLSFYKLFLQGAIYRENCYHCPYARMERCSDLTVGDYWGIEEAHAAQFRSGEMEQRSDWSCLLVNTKKGRRFLETCGGELTLVPTKPEWIARKNRQLNAPTEKPAHREQVLTAYRHGGYRKVENDYIKSNGGSLRFHWQMLKNLRRNGKKASGGSER